ncbi:hypothetical protein DPSP01_002013 [Paraphaeosphaeria sporulosa]|uniref:GPI anchored CFEM domain-containing protein n=1 Tax=Paraphaeosphaeria sporulosa TaxID=1460663 RepID=A0A177CZY4_9PLEO|nr:GPI anchored CFEM domain-containing protein [Paraphaeosphaeria sporulosa]OAG12537.1 GPI anchored CFEM domain-containing protein [Paraphaeosphaeria sporulosa]
MKTFVPALLVALAGVASAQLADLPQCSLQCFLTALGSDGCSELTDFKCHCEKSDALLASVTPCVQGACTADEQAEVIKGVENTCASAGVTISVPAPSATAAPESSSAAPESSAEASSTEAASSSAAPSSYEVPASTSAAASSSVSAVPLPSANGTVPSSTPAPTQSEFPGAASRIGAAAGLVGAAAFAVFAL